MFNSDHSRVTHKIRSFLEGVLALPPLSLQGREVARTSLESVAAASKRHCAIDNANIKQITTQTSRAVHGIVCDSNTIYM